jgi:hypothetical protein
VAAFRIPRHMAVLIFGVLISIIFCLVHIVAYLLKARTVKPAETAVARERLCKRPLLGNIFVTRSSGVIGKRCSLHDPCDSCMTQQ